MRIFLLLTDKCNLNCSMCIRGKQDGNDMDFEIFSDLLIKEDFSDIELVITGGEPTLHPYFVEFVKKASLKFRKVMVATNGTTNYYIDELKKIDNLMFQISLDGDEKSHDKIRGFNSYKKVIETIRRFEENNLNYCIASVVGLNNRETIFNLIPILKKLDKMKFWRISYEMPFGNSCSNKFLSSSEWNDFVDNILKKVNFKLSIKKIFCFELYDKYLEQMNIYTKNRSLNCGSGSNTIYVYPNFNVYPCTCLTDFCIGNLKTDSLKNILMSKFIQKFSCYEMDKDTPCHSCKYFKFCNGGCIGMSYNIIGSLGKGDIRCPILRSYYEKKNILL
ncbi:radical SAM/SPASM domain-containing protein [Clostridium perfringens]|uniref:radical SAM/SPASM domain-containing protein n=1 Tax=Clostridium perfringens TaxID=1502 RepID=UPI0032DB067F